MNKDAKLKKLSTILCYEFNDNDLLKKAFTHKSIQGKLENYERLEFLGDRVLSIFCAKMIFDRFPNESEGELSRRFTQLVREQTLAEIASDCGFEMYVSVNENMTKIHSNIGILADVVESAIGAMFCDGGISAPEKFIEKHFTKYIDKFLNAPKDSKSTLQEWSQKKRLGFPNYELIEKTGMEHLPLFTISVCVDGYERVSGNGKNKQEATQMAAINFLEKYKIK